MKQRMMNHSTSTLLLSASQEGLRHQQTPKDTDDNVLIFLTSRHDREMQDDEATSGKRVKIAQGKPFFVEANTGIGGG